MDARRHSELAPTKNITSVERKSDREVVDLFGADHFDVIEPNGEGWAAVIRRLPALLRLEDVR